MKKYMPLEGLRWSRDSGSALCDTSQNSRSRTGWGGTMLSCMAGNESEAIKKSGIRGETKLFLGENGSYQERNPHFFVDFFPTHSPFSPLSVF